MSALLAVCVVLSSSDKTNGFPIQNNHQAAAVGLCWADSVIPITHLWLIEFDFLFSIIYTPESILMDVGPDAVIFKLQDWRSMKSL